MSYSVGTGGASSWSSPVDVPSNGLALGSKKIRHIKLASSPSTDEMILVASNEDLIEFALVWDGSSWGSQQLLHAKVSGDSVTDVNVAYESLSGHALVVFGMAEETIRYVTWDGSSWSTSSGSSDSLDYSSFAQGNLEWTDVASDPNSNAILVGAVTEDGNPDIFTACWSGTSWTANTIRHTDNAGGDDHPAVSVAFESTSSAALVVFNVNSDDEVKYRALSSTGSITDSCNGACSGPMLTAQPKSVRLSSDPVSDQVALMVQDNGDDVYHANWNGATWSLPTTLSTDTDASHKYEPMLFLWGVNATGSFAFWASKDIFYPFYMEWDYSGQVLNSNKTGLIGASNPGQWVIIQGAESPISDEAIILGVAKDGDNEIRGKVLTDASLNIWQDIAVPTSIPSPEPTTEILTDTLKSTTYWSFDVQYESQSGKSLIVWSDGSDATSGTTGIMYSVGTGLGDNQWSEPLDVPPGTVALTQKAWQVRMASNPNTDEIILVSSNEDKKAFAAVWNGATASWGSQIELRSDSFYFTDINVAYESQTGRGMVVFSQKPCERYIQYVVWDEGSWGSITPITTYNGQCRMTGGTQPPIPDSPVRWTRIESDPRSSSNSILMVVLTEGKDVWTSFWDGSDWTQEILHTGNSKYNDRPSISVAFENLSGRALLPMEMPIATKMSITKYSTTRRCRNIIRNHQPWCRRDHFDSTSRTPCQTMDHHV